MKVYNSLTESVGGTPLLKLWEEGAKVFAKLEYFNPLGSVKDRAALAIVEDAEKSGKIKEGGTIIEATSGNTGIGLAFVAAARGYKMILTMPESMSLERRMLLGALGAEIVLTPAKLGMKGAVEESERICASLDNAFLAMQFENPANPAAHYRATGPEIYDDLNGNIDVFIAGIGTGGTFSGVVKYLKEKNPSLYAIAVEPEESPMISKAVAGAHRIQGIGANFVPKNFDRSLADEILTVTSDDAIAMTKRLAREKGLLVGISSGASARAAEIAAARGEFAGKTIVCILPDSGERYLSTGIFQD